MLDRDPASRFAVNQVNSRFNFFDRDEFGIAHVRSFREIYASIVFRFAPATEVKTGGLETGEDGYAVR